MTYNIVYSFFHCRGWYERVFVWFPCGPRPPVRSSGSLLGHARRERDGDLVQEPRPDDRRGPVCGNRGVRSGALGGGGAGPARRWGHWNYLENMVNFLNCTTVKPELAVTSIKQPTCLKQPNRRFLNFNVVLIFTSAKQPPALSSCFLCFPCVAAYHRFDCIYDKVWDRV